MISIEFLITSLIVVLVPGTGVIFTVSTGIVQGRKASVYAALGCTAGILPHLLATVLGLAAIMHTSALAFQVLKYAGVAYLLYVAFATWRDKSAFAVESSAPKAGAVQLVTRAILLNVLNPKLTIFFLAFLPQFVTVPRGHVGEQIVWLGVVFVLLGMITDSLYALTAGSAARWLRGRPGFLSSERWLSGGLYIGLGVVAALSSGHRK